MVCPSSASSRATWAETLDWTVCRARAAAEKLPWSATATTALSWRRSILFSDGSYLEQLLDRSREKIHNQGAYKHEAVTDPSDASEPVPGAPPLSMPSEKEPAPPAGSFFALAAGLVASPGGRCGLLRSRPDPARRGQRSRVLRRAAAGAQARQPPESLTTAAGGLCNFVGIPASSQAQQDGKWWLPPQGRGLRSAPA